MHINMLNVVSSYNPLKLFLLAKLLLFPGLFIVSIKKHVNVVDSGEILKQIGRWRHHKLP